MPQLWAQLQTRESGGDRRNRTYDSHNQYCRSFSNRVRKTSKRLGNEILVE